MAAACDVSQPGRNTSDAASGIHEVDRLTWVAITAVLPLALGPTTAVMVAAPSFENALFVGSKGSSRAGLGGRSRPSQSGSGPPCRKKDLALVSSAQSCISS